MGNSTKQCKRLNYICFISISDNYFIFTSFSSNRLHPIHSSLTAGNTAWKHFENGSHQIGPSSLFFHQLNNVIYIWIHILYLILQCNTFICYQLSKTFFHICSGVHLLLISHELYSSNYWKHASICVWSHTSPYLLSCLLFL